MYNPAKHYARIEDGQVISIPTTNSIVTIMLHWQRCYRLEPCYRNTPGYVGWFSYQNIRLRSITSSTYVVLANARDSISESPPTEQEQFDLKALFEELNTVAGKEVEALSVLCFEQDKNPDCWILKRRYPQISTDRLFDVASYGGHTITANLSQMSVLYYCHSGDNSLWI